MTLDRLRPLLAAGLVAAWAVAAPPGLRGQGGGTVAAADAASGQVSLLDTNCWGVASRLDLGGRVHQVAPARRGGRAYVAHSTAEVAGRRRGDDPGGRTARRIDRSSEASGTVTVVDLLERRTVDRFDLGGTGPISDVWAGHEGGRIWVALERDGRVLTLDARTGDLLMEWTIGRTSPQSGAVGRNDRYLFVTNREAGTLTVIDRVTVAANTVPLDRGAGPVEVGPGGEAWVADADDDRVWVVDRRSGDVLAELRSGGRGPVDLERRPGEHEMWVLHGESGGLGVFDTGRRERTAWIDVPGRPRSVRFSADGGRALVTVPDRGLVVALDAVHRRIEGSFRVPLQPGWMAWASCSRRECREESDRWHKGAAGLPGERWTKADLVGDLWCGG